MAMGSPLGPTFANIFMCHLEELFLSQCPSHFKPLFYRRYVDDTFLLFKDKDHASLFLDYINSFHQNIKFTMDVESLNQLPFLDINVSRCDGKFVTSVYRKNTFTGLGLNFFSHCPLNFKLNSCKTLLFRAFSLCSNWTNFDVEVAFLRNYFIKNCYPSGIFDKLIRNFLNNIFLPKPITATVPKKRMYVSLPFMPNSSSVKRELTSTLSTLYPYVDFYFVFRNPLNIGSMFSFKDILPKLMRSCVVYFFNCPKCNFGTYVGCTKRLCKTRIDSHRGVSHRTGSILAKKEYSAIRLHTNICKHKLNYNDFKILSQTNNHYSLPILESLFIKQLSPNLNNQTTSFPLHIA